MKHYELLAVLPGTLTETEAHEIATQVKETVEKNGGTSIEQEYNGKSRLAYPMRHIRYGYFFLFTFEATEADVITIQAKIRLIGQILRFLCKIYNPSQKVSLNFGDTAQTQPDPELGTEKKEEIVAKEVPEMDLVQPVAVAETPAEPEETPKAAEPKEKNDISMEEIDQKLDELLLKSDV